MALCKKCTEFNSIICTILSCTTDTEGRHHSFNDEPSIIKFCDSKRWHKHNMVHRLNGPAEITHYESDYGLKKNTSTCWYYNGIAAINIRSAKVKDVIELDTERFFSREVENDFGLTKKLFIVPKGSMVLIINQLSDRMFEGLWGNKKLYLVTSYD